MKKFLLLLILLLSLPLNVKAADYKITDQFIEANILSNGDLEVTELIVMDGTFNGYEKTLTYANSSLDDDYTYDYNSNIYNAYGLNLLDIKAKYVSNVSFDTINDTDFEVMTQRIMGENGDKGIYTMRTDYNSYTYRLYYASNRQRVAFKIRYRLDRVIVNHLDVAELYWNFITPNYYDDMENIIVKVNLPGVDNSDNFRVWAHGDLAGEITKNKDNSGVVASIKEMSADSSLDIRITFDKDLITDKTKVKETNVNALPKILNIEEKRANEANELREKLQKEWHNTVYLTVGLYIAMVILGLYIYFKYGRSPKPNYYSKYNREFINDYNVEVIDYLMNRKITPNALSASIMNLIYKKNISLEENKESNSKEKAYTFVLENRDNLNSSENILVDFLFSTVSKKTNADNKPIFTMLDLKLYANGVKTCDEFIASYTKWKNDVLKLAKEEKFYESSSRPKVIGVIMLIISFLVFYYGSSVGTDFVPNNFIFLAGMIFMLYTILVYKKSVKGSEHYAKWQAFKNFLDDFGAFELKELPEIILWERYLVYATIFGLAKKVQKAMNVKIKELNITNDYVYYPSYFYLDLSNSINNSISNAISGAYNRRSANYANSHSSSSSGGGFGGGFSSGGGFGGGGSSGHGF